MSVGNHLDAVGYGYREKVSQGNVENEKMRWTYETNWGTYWQSSF